jgi:hypothetical protein
MTITLSLWMMVPAVLIVLGGWHSLNEDNGAALGGAVLIAALCVLTRMVP